MAATVALYRTSIGKKAVMAVTGFILYLFMIAHIYGNLKVFEGREKFNAYSDYLRTVGNPIFFRTELFWIIRVVLLVSVILHIVAAAQLTQRSYASRPVRYVNKKETDATFASRTMRWGGLVIFFFIIYHILDLTLGTAHSGAYQAGDVYGNVVSGFSHWYVTALLHPRDDRARLPSLSRCLEYVPDARRQSPQVQPLLPGPRARLGAADRRRRLRRPARGADRNRQLGRRSSDGNDNRPSGRRCGPPRPGRA